MAKYEPRAQMFIARRMRDFHAGTMRGRDGRVVRSKKQALAIALSESRAKGLHVPREKETTAMAKSKKGRVPPHLKPYLFKKGHGMPKKKHHKKKHHSTALVPYRSAPVVITKTRRVTVPVRVRSKSGGGRSLMRRELGSGEFMPGPYRMRSAAVAAALGYAKGGHGLTGLNDIIEKLPSIGNVPKTALAALILNKFADRGDWFDAGAQALIDISAYEFGQGGFKMSGEDD